MLRSNLFLKWEYVELHNLLDGFYQQHDTQKMPLVHTSRLHAFGQRRGTSNPEVLDVPLLAPASELEDAGLDITPFDRKQLIVDMCETRRILIIGWRWVWTKDENRLKNRIYEIARSAGPGSYIVFMNQMATEDNSINFKENLERTGVVKPIFSGDGGDGGTKLLPGCTAGWRLTEYPHVRVFHAERKNVRRKMFV